MVHCIWLTLTFISFFWSDRQTVVTFATLSSHNEGRSIKVQRLHEYTSMSNVIFVNRSFAIFVRIGNLASHRHLHPYKAENFGKKGELVSPSADSLLRLWLWMSWRKFEHYTLYHVQMWRPDEPDLIHLGMVVGHKFWLGRWPWASSMTNLVRPTRSWIDSHFKMRHNRSIWPPLWDWKQVKFLKFSPT